MIQREYLAHFSTLFLGMEPGEVTVTHWGPPELPSLEVTGLEGIKYEAVVGTVSKDDTDYGSGVTEHTGCSLSPFSELM